MIRCLIIKTSSLGDIIHTLPAITDAVNALGDIEFDWVVEETFAEIPAWHPAVKTVIPVAIRRWRRQPLKTLFSKEWKQFKQNIAASRYDCIIDAQGLLKSAWLTRYTHGPVYGLDKNSAREPLASRFYDQPFKVNKDLHAVERLRQLFAGVLGYTYTAEVDYGISGSDKESAVTGKAIASGVLFFHGTTWATKHWPESYWQELAQQLVAHGYTVFLPWGSEPERLRVQTIKKAVEAPEQVIILPKMSLTEIKCQLSAVRAVVSVDTGLAHLAAALDKPQISLFGPTNPGLTRPYGNNQVILQVDYPCKACMQKKCNKPAVQDDKKLIYPACFSSLKPKQVYQQLVTLTGGQLS